MRRRHKNLATISRSFVFILLLSAVSIAVGVAHVTGAPSHHLAGQPAWQQQIALTASDGVAGDHLGGPVALSGDTALVGAWDKHGGAGAAYVFVRQGRQWTQQAELTAGDGATGDWFGVSVALSGNTALVGAPLAGHAGAAYVFVRSSGRWREQARLRATDGAAGDWFGRSVALRDDTALVSAWYQHGDTGAAYLFARRGSDWSQQARLVAADGRAEDYFGSSVALGENIALVGAAGTDDNTGSVYVFGRGASLWTQHATLRAGDGKPGDTFGTAVAMSGDTVLVGAGFAHRRSGAAYVFTRSGGQWAVQARLTATDGATGDWFGRSVALSGNTALVGAWYAQNHTGAAYVFVRHAAQWSQQARLRASDGVGDDYFGSSVALGDDSALVGAGFRHHAMGAVYVFTYRPAAG